MKPRLKGRLSWVGMLAALTTVALMFTAHHADTTLAAWTDAEWVTGGTDHSISTLNCRTPIPTNQVATRAVGQFASGTALGQDLASIAALSGVRVTDNGTRVLAQPASAQPVSSTPDAYQNPLVVSALEVPLPNLAPALLIPLNTSAGAAGQFAQAQNTGNTHAASGLITGSGAINLTATPTAATDVATVSLSQLLNAVGLNLGTLVSGVTDASIRVGAVASTAALNGCEQLWSHNTAQHLTRDYLVAGVQMSLTSPTVGALVSGVTSIVTNLNTTTTNIQNNTAVKTTIVNGVTDLLNGVLDNSILGLASINVTTLTAQIDTSALTTYLSAPITDSNGVITIHPTAGTVTVNTAALFGQAYPGQTTAQLNGLSPNTNILSDTAALATLNTTLTSTLSSWISGITTQLLNIVNSAVVQASVALNLEVDSGIGIVQIGSITASVNGSLAHLIAGGVPATITTNLNLGILGALVKAVVDPLLTTLLSTLRSGLGTIVGSAVSTALNPYRAVDVATAALTTPLITAVSNLYNALFLSGVVSATVNVQNDPSSGAAEPADWVALPAGQFDVAALRVGVLNIAQQNAIAIYLARSSVGEVCPAANLTGQCVNY